MKKILFYILLCVAFTAQTYAQRVIYHQMQVNYMDGYDDSHFVEEVENAKFVYRSYDEVLAELLYMSSWQAYDVANFGVYLSQAITLSAVYADYPYYAPYSCWNFTERTSSPLWTRFYNNIGINARALLNEAQQTNMRNYELIARTLLLNSLLNATDFYGELPVSSSYMYATGQPSATPHFNTQEEIYAYLEEQFEDLLAKYKDPAWINCPTNATISAEGDPIFQGDITKWRAYTKALYARFLLRQIPNRNNTPEMCAKIIAAADDALNDASWTEPRYQYSGETREQTCPWVNWARPYGWEYRYGYLSNSIPTNFFTSAILGAFSCNKGAVAVEDLSTGKNVNARNKGYYSLDPRGAKMMEPREYRNENYVYSTYLRGIESNAGIEVWEKTYYFPDLHTYTTQTNPYVSDSGYIALITHEELLFIKAEAQYWAGKKTDAYNTTIQAVEHNMDRYQVDRTTEPYNHIYNMFLAVKLPQDSFTIADLMQQKYVAMYLQPEQWTDMRRYNYSSPTNGVKYDDVYVYEVKRLRNTKDLGRPQVKLAQFPAENTYALTRPHNLHADYWKQADCYQGGDTTLLSDKAWINRINPTPAMCTQFKDELIRLGAYNADSTLNYRWLQKKMIWQ